MYYSQYGQDKILNEKYFSNKKNGVFLDIGAHDGVSLSNTYFFESELGWSGICFEPIPSVFKKLKGRRNCNLVNGCAWNENTTKTFRVIEGYSEMLSGIVDTYNESHIRRIESECNHYGLSYNDIEVKCYDLNEILIENNIKHIDFISIDTEGSELEILKKIDFSLFDIDFILVEDNYNSIDLDSFLIVNGYKLVETISIDKLYKKY